MVLYCERILTKCYIIGIENGPHPSNHEAEHSGATLGKGKKHCLKLKYSSCNIHLYALLRI